MTKYTCPACRKKERKMDASPNRCRLYCANCGLTTPVQKSKQSAGRVWNKLCQPKKTTLQ